MAGTSEWAELGQLIVVAGGTTGILAVLKFFSDRKRDKTKEGVDLQKVLADSSAQTISTLQALYRDCEVRHKECQDRVEAVEGRVDDLEAALRVIPTLRQRDDLLRQAVISSGMTMPALPQVNWHEVEFKSRRTPSGQRPVSGAD